MYSNKATAPNSATPYGPKEAIFIQTTTETDLDYWHQVLLQFIIYAPESEANFHFPCANIVKDLKLTNELLW